MSETANPIFRIKEKERDLIIQALSAGVVPRIGLQHLQVGRVNEVRASVKDLDRIADGGSAFRIIIGPYGAGKTFFLNLIRALALEKRLVTAHADLAPDRRLYASGGQARNLYQESVRNLSTRTRPEGGALQSILERVIADASQEATASGQKPEAILDARLQALTAHNGGYDFARVINLFGQGFRDGNETLKGDAVRWLRGEYTTRTEAKNALGVRTIVDDENVYDQMKLLSAFVRVAGYKGLLIVFDEMVNLYKLQHTQSRNQNYEQILRILNDLLQGDVKGLGVYLGGTPEFLRDTRRGLFSYPALSSRLSENQFATGGLVDFSQPVLQLANLSPEDLHVLLENIRAVFAMGEPSKYLVPDEAIQAFMHHCESQIGAAYFQTPRNSVREFVKLLSTLEQNPEVAWSQLIKQTVVKVDDDAIAGEPDDELTSIQL